MSLTELANLKPGDVIDLEAWTGGNAFLRSGGVRSACTLISSDRRQMRFSTDSKVASGAGAGGGAVSERGKGTATTAEDFGELIAKPFSEVIEELRKGFSRLHDRINALGDDQTAVSKSVDLPEETRTEDTFGFFGPADGEALGACLKHEHPQTIALVLAKVGQPLALDVFQRLDPEMRVEVAGRMYQSAKVSPDVVDAVRRALEHIVLNRKDEETASGTARKRLIEMLDKMSKNAIGQIVEGVGKRAPEISEEIRKTFAGGSSG